MGNANLYWKANLKVLFSCLLVWFLVSYGCGLFFVDQLNQIRVGGYKLGFWFAHQGSMYAFVILIFYYVKKMNQIDRKFNVNED